MQNDAKNPAGGGADRADGAALDDLITEALSLTQEPAEGQAAPDDGPLPLHEFLGLSWPEPEFLLSPLLRAGTVSMIAGQREAGKSMLAMSLALACATNTPTLGGLLHAPRAVRTLYLDGENGGQEMHERFKYLLGHLPRNTAPVDFLYPLVPERCPGQEAPDITKPEGQAYVFDLVETHKFELVFLDNLSCLAGGGDENSATDFEPVQKFLLWLKARNIATVLLSHVGKDKSRGPRGSSKRTDALSTLIEIAKPEGDSAGDGLRFEWRVTKSRHRIPPEVRQPLLVELHESGWKTQPLAAITSVEDLIALKEAGMSGRDIARETGLSKSEVYRRLAAMKGGGNA